MRLLVYPLIALLSACASHTGAPSQTKAVNLPDTDYRVVRSIRYTPADWPESLTADIYQPEGQGPFPAVLVVHGGGWEGRTPADMESISKRLASSGFVAVNIAYRFAPQYRFPAQLHDLQIAMHWIQRNADSYAIDRENVSALGYSAGAHLVSLLGLVAGTGNDLDKSYGGEETKPAAVVAGARRLICASLPAVDWCRSFWAGLLTRFRKPLQPPRRRRMCMLRHRPSSSTTAPPICWSAMTTQPIFTTNCRRQGFTASCIC